MAVQHGAMPIFPNSGCVAEVVYNNAREILREINNSDSLTDYQKTLNIYRYICMNVKYDNILFDYMSAINNSSVRTFGKFSPFYLEGVLYDLDNQIAVCDGLSKAFALMCNIEGIEATKVNGFAGSAEWPNGWIYDNQGLPPGWGDHAWNKVKIDDNYYMVDTTWGTASDGDFEMLTHTYFLVSEETLTTHRATYCYDDAQTTDYDYYEKTMIKGVSIYAETKAEYEILIQKVFEERRSFIEIKLSAELIAAAEEEYGTIKNLLGCKNGLSQVATYFVLGNGTYLLQLTYVA
jgi:hypothetical protein